MSLFENKQEPRKRKRDDLGVLVATQAKKHCGPKFDVNDPSYTRFVVRRRSNLATSSESLYVMAFDSMQRGGGGASTLSFEFAVAVEDQEIKKDGEGLVFKQQGCSHFFRNVTHAARLELFYLLLSGKTQQLADKPSRLRFFCRELLGLRVRAGSKGVAQPIALIVHACFDWGWMSAVRSLGDAPYFDVRGEIARNTNLNPDVASIVAEYFQGTMHTNIATLGPFDQVIFRAISRSKNVYLRNLDVLAGFRPFELLHRETLKPVFQGNSLDLLRTSMVDALVGHLPRYARHKGGRYNFRFRHDNMSVVGTANHMHLVQDGRMAHVTLCYSGCGGYYPQLVNAIEKHKLGDIRVLCDDVDLCLFLSNRV